MRIEHVKQLPDSLDRLAYWIMERETIRLRREAQQAKPWTDDLILQGFRFCNVRRMDDKVSRWLFKNWYLPYHDHFNMLPAVALARLVNNPAALEAVGFPERWNPALILKRLRAFRETGATVFNSAYMVRGGKKGGDKLEEVVYDYCHPLRGLKIPTHSMQEAHTAVLGCYGFGSFMAGQVVADLRWALDGAWSDRMTWAPVGPGSSRGMSRLLDRPPSIGMPQRHFIEYLAWMMQEVRERVPTRITERLEAQDFQSCLCEWDKHERILWGEGRPKQRYPGNA